MRANKYGIKRFKGVRLDRGLVYFWVPPIPLQKARIFRHTTLGTDFGRAIAKACELNSKLGSYRGDSAGIKRTLTLIRPMTVGFLVREFESSPRFARYAPRTRQDYA